MNGNVYAIHLQRLAAIKRGTPNSVDQGVKQSHAGYCYITRFDEKGDRKHEIVQPCEPSERTLAKLQPVRVTSQSDLPLIPIEDNEPWVLAALEKGHLFKRGEQYNSLALYQGGAE